jgi:TonB-dependent receptor
MHRIITFLYILAFIVTILIKPLSAAGSNIQGIVKDGETGEPLYGANVILVGTSMGAATDIDGKYVIPSVPAGTYTIHVSYLGYVEQQKEINVKAGANTSQDFKLKAVGLKGETVIVTAQASGQQQAINQQLSSDNIVNVVSADKIQELPDANAAESIGRLPGISVLRSGGEANEVVIRGLAPKFNRISIDGVQLTSSNPNDESVDLSMISSNMLEGMEVSETVTPDMSAEVIGGVVNLELREARVKVPGVPEFGFLVQGGYNGLSDAYNKYNNYKYVGSLDDRLLDGKFGIFAQIDVERKNLTSNELGASYGPLDNQLDKYVTNGLNLDDISRDRQRYNGAFVLDYILPEGSIKFSNFLSSGTTDAQDRNEYFDLAGSSGNLHNYVFNYEDSTVTVITNALNLQYQLPIFHMNLSLSHAYTETKDPQDWSVTFEQGSAGLGGLINQPNLNPESVPIAANDILSETNLNTLSNKSSFSGARALTASLDFDANENLSDQITSVIKFGGMYRYQTRTYFSNTTGSQGLAIQSAAYVDNLIETHFPALASNANTTSIPMAAFLDPNFKFGTFLSGNYNMHYPLNFNMLSALTTFLRQNASLIAQNNDAISYFNDQFNSETYNYTGDENQSAVYVMATANIGPQLTLIPGVRYQNLQTTYTGTRGIENTNSALGLAYNHYDTTVTENHGFWLPDVSLKYKALSWLDVRLSYTNTLAYPDYNAIIPRIDVSEVGSIYYNNYNLVPSRSTNYDLNLSLYDNTLGLITIGGYLKQISNLIYSYNFFVVGQQALQYFPQQLVSIPPTGTYQIYTYINDPYRASDYGLEFSWQTHLWYLPQPLNGLVLDINYTHCYSTEKYPYVNEEFVTSGRSKIEVFDTTSYTDKLLYQPDDIVNLSLGYDYQGFSIRVSMIYEDNIFSGPDFWPALRTTTAAYRRWDISAKQELPWFGVQIYGDVNNLNSENDVQVIQAPTGVPQSEQDYGMTADLGIRLKL